MVPAAESPAGITAKGSLREGNKKIAQVFVQMF